MPILLDDVFSWISLLRSSYFLIYIDVFIITDVDCHIFYMV